MQQDTAGQNSIDAAIIGGGIAGTWALNLLRKQGYNVILLEAEALGCGQTLASQGMVHGGLKYALSGVLTGASEAIADMPERWRACLGSAGTDGTTGDGAAAESGANACNDVDLRGTRLLSSHYYMFAEGTTLGRLTTFFASRALRGRINRIRPADWPAEFRGFNGVVYEVNDFVLDTEDLLRTLTRDHEPRVLAFHASADTITPGAQGYAIHLADKTVHAAQLISCAGNGSAALMAALGVSGIDVQQRPLKQVIVKPEHDMALFAHCLTGISTNEPRLTITSHRRDGELIWYLGGALADEGVKLSDAEQIQRAREELNICVPWLEWDNARYEVLAVDRAEPKQGSGLKPDQAYVQRVGDFIQCFPTKLTLAPDLGDKLLAAMDPPRHGEAFVTTQPRAHIGVSPW